MQDGRTVWIIFKQAVADAKKENSASHTAAKTITFHWYIALPGSNKGQIYEVYQVTDTVNIDIDVRLILLRLSYQIYC